MSSLRGQLGLKSGPLAPTSSKLTTQYLVLDHMNNHFNKIAKAKPAIDTRPPKSLTTSQKMRDRKHRTRLSSTSPRLPSPMTPQDLQQYEDVLNDEPEDEEERLVQNIMKSTLIEKSRGSNNATYGSESATYLQHGDTYMSQQEDPYFSQSRTMTRPHSARSTRSVGSVTNAMRASIPVKTHDQTRITYAGDILEKRAHKFTDPERPFTPRINASNHESRLRSSKCYNPPKPKNDSKKSNNNIYAYRESKSARESRHNRKMQKSNRDLTESLETAELSESMLMDITLRSRDDRHESEAEDQVPRLDISMDKDHLNWLQEQASKAKVRARTGAQISKSQLMGDITPIAEEHSARSSNSLRTENKMKPLSPKRKSSSWFSYRLYEEEEEQKYLTFAKEVTDDVLSRGISTDKVLSRVFENHIERRKDDLDETRMRGVIHDLKKDLGLRDCGQERSLEHSLADFNYNNHKIGGNDDEDLNNTEKSYSKKSSVKEVAQNNGVSSNSLDPRGLGSTLESTSTMQFGQTADVFSTINSEATLEREAERDREVGDELGETQDEMLKQYQLSLKVSEGDTTNGGPSTDVSSKSPNLAERPATGERRTSVDERSDSSSVNSKPTRTRRRDRPRKRFDSFEDVMSSETSGQTNGISSLTNGSDPGESSLIQTTDLSGNNQTTDLSGNTESGNNETLTSGNNETSNSISSQKPQAKPRLGKTANSNQDSGNGDENRGSTAGSLEETTESLKASSVAGKETETQEEADIEEEYEDDYDEEDEELGETTHRTSDEDF